MPSTSETGHAKNVANWSKAETACTGYGANYTPTNPNLTVASIKAKYIAADAAVKAVGPVSLPYKKAVEIRSDAFDAMEVLMTRAFGTLETSVDVSAVSVDSAKFLLDKIKGVSSKNSTGTTTTTPAKKHHSTSQQSYDLKLSHCRKFIDVLVAEPKYKFSDADLDIVELEKFYTKLSKINKDVQDAYVPYLNALKKRDTELYADKTGVYDLAKALKKFIRTVTTTKISVTEKKLIIGLKFTKPSKKQLFL